MRILLPPGPGPRGHPAPDIRGLHRRPGGGAVAYDGWNNVSMVSSEVRNPQRNLPLALIGGTLAVIAIYLLANWAYFHVLTAREVAGADRPAAEMMRKIFDGPGANAVAIAAMISIFAALNGSILSGSRVPTRPPAKDTFSPPLAASARSTTRRASRF